MVKVNCKVPVLIFQNVFDRKLTTLTPKESFYETLSALVVYDSLDKEVAR